MTTNHHCDGAGGFVRPELDAIPAFAAFFTNDNEAPQRLQHPEGATGLVLAAEYDDANMPIVTIRLRMQHGFIGPLVHTAHHGDEIIAVWRGLGRDLNLPLYVLDNTGRCMALTHIPGEISYARRGGAALSGRRPRFLMRRKPPNKEKLALCSPCRQQA